MNWSCVYKAVCLLIVECEGLYIHFTWNAFGNIALTEEPDYQHFRFDEYFFFAAFSWMAKHQTKSFYSWC